MRTSPSVAVVKLALPRKGPEVILCRSRRVSTGERARSRLRGRGSGAMLEAVVRGKLAVVLFLLLAADVGLIVLHIARPGVEGTAGDPFNLEQEGGCGEFFQHVKEV